MTASDLRKAWFDRGVEAFHRLAPMAPSSCACPLCGALFSQEDLDEDLLSLEHAPPHALGGRPICLTCRKCNNTAGRTVDAHMRRRENVFDLLRGTMQQSRPARIGIGPQSMVADYYHGGGGVLIMGVPKANPPWTTQQIQAEMDRRVGPVSELSFRVDLYKDDYNNQLARVGWLRSAYLVAFAVFGYTYAFQRRLAAVRQQLDEPEASIIEMFSVVLPDAAFNQRQFVVVDEPHDLRGLAIQMGRNLVYLPWLDDRLYANLAERSRANRRVGENLRGVSFPWPTEPSHLIDLDRIPGIERKHC